MLSVTAGHIPPQYMSFVQFTPPPRMLCLYNISPKKPYTNILYADKFSNYMYQQTHRSGTALCVLPPIFVYIKYILLPTTL